VISGNPQKLVQQRLIRDKREWGNVWFIKTTQNVKLMESKVPVVVSFSCSQQKCLCGSPMALGIMKMKVIPLSVPR